MTTSPPHRKICWVTDNLTLGCKKKLFHRSPSWDDAKSWSDLLTWRSFNFEWACRLFWTWIINGPLQAILELFSSEQVLANRDSKRVWTCLNSAVLFLNHIVTCHSSVVPNYSVRYCKAHKALTAVGKYCLFRYSIKL